MSDDVTIKIPRPLYNRLQKIIAETGFRSVTEFIVYVLRDLASAHPEVAGLGSGRAAPSSGTERGLTAREIELIRRRLKNLGYLDP